MKNKPNYNSYSNVIFLFISSCLLLKPMFFFILKRVGKVILM